MFFANLGLGPVLALFAGISLVSVALYLFSRSRRRVVVSTLRFFTAAQQPSAVHRRTRIEHPLSLLLQLLAMLLLLLAIAQLRLGTEGRQPRRHVLVLETSAWMASRATSGQTLMDQARARARAYLRALPASDEVMLVRADSLATPATSFESGLESGRANLESAIAQSEPSATSLNLEQAFSVARTAQGNAAHGGEIVFIGSGRVDESDVASANLANLRVLTLGKAPDNLGLRKVSARRSATDSGEWEILVAVRNYGARAREATVSASVSGAPAGAQRLPISANGESEATFRYRTRAAGILDVVLLPSDAFPADNRARVELPSAQPLAVTVFSEHPEEWKALLSADAQIVAAYKQSGQYTPGEKGLVILDRFRPAQRPASPTIWVDPPAGGSPIPVKMRIPAASQLRWLTGDPLGLGLHTRDVRLPSTSIFSAAPGDLKIAETDAGPVIVARPGSPKLIAIGFHPSAIRYELVTPLLFANIFRWIAPDAFLDQQLSTQPAGSVTAAFPPGTDPATLRVLRSDGTPLPFTVHEGIVTFFSGTPGTVRVLAGDRERIYGLTLPQLAASQWTVPAGARTGMPGFRDTVSSYDIWRYLAIGAALILVFEWIRWGRAAKRISAGNIHRFRKAA